MGGTLPPSSFLFTPFPPPCVVPAYNDGVQERKNIQCSQDNKYFHQDDLEEAAERKSCQFKRSWLEQCSGLQDPHFGFSQGKPCVLLRMNRVRDNQSHTGRICRCSHVKSSAVNMKNSATLWPTWAEAGGVMNLWVLGPVTVLEWPHPAQLCAPHLDVDMWNLFSEVVVSVLETFQFTFHFEVQYYMYLWVSLCTCRAALSWISNGNISKLDRKQA